MKRKIRAKNGVYLEMHEADVECEALWVALSPTPSLFPHLLFSPFNFNLSLGVCCGACLPSRPAEQQACRPPPSLCDW